MLAQERTQRRAPGFRPGTLLQGSRAGGAELAALRFAQTSSAFSRPESPSARGSIRERKVKTEGIPAPRHNNGLAVRQPPGARLRARHATAKGRACPGCRKTQPSSTGNTIGTAVVLTLSPPLSSRRVERIFAGKRRWMSERSEFSAAREKPRSEGNPGPRSGPGSRQSGVFLGYFFARAKKDLGARWRVSARQYVDRRHRKHQRTNQA